MTNQTKEVKPKDTFVIEAYSGSNKGGKLLNQNYFYLSNDGFNFTKNKEEIWQLSSLSRANTHIAKYFTSLKSGVYTDIKAVKYSDIK